MKVNSRKIGLTSLLFIISATAFGQGDWAVYETFTRNSPAVYSVSVEIPKDYIMQRYDNTVKRLSEYQEVVAGGGDVGSFSFFENLIKSWERQLEIYKNQMLENNREQGAGFAIDSNHLVTLSTVVKSATLGGNIILSSDSRKELNAKLLGMDKATGIAVLEVKDASFPTHIDIHHISGKLPIASYIMTIQRPYDLHATPFSGMIGGYYRRLNLFELERYIQTDLPLFPGNEGAPVFSPSGQLIGMIATEFHVGNWPRISFIIPSDLILDSATEIIEKGKKERGWIPGLEFKDALLGIIITELEKDSPAAKAGLKEGDNIVKFNGREVNQGIDLLYYILSTKPNEEVNMQIQRGTRHLEVVVETSRRQQER